MFDDSDFEFDDEAIDAVFDNMPSVVSNKTVQKRPCEEEKIIEKQGNTIQIDHFLRPAKKPKENTTISNKFQNIKNDVYDQFQSIERTSVKFDCVDNSDRLSPIICYNEPSSSSYVHKNTVKKVVQRKFPGPAGLLPEQMDKNNFTKRIDDDFYFKNVQNTEEPMLVSQCCELSFDDKLWKRMLEDLEHEKIDSEYILPEKYNIEWIKSKAVNNQLVNQKAPFLAALIQSLNIKSPVPTVTLRDKTGEIQATIDYDLYKEYVAELAVGSVIIIKQFSVVPTGTSYILNVTVKNLIRIYHENNSEKQSTLHEKLDDNIFSESPISPEQIKIINLQDLSVNDIIKNIKEISDYKREIEISDEALGVFLDDFNKNFDNNKANSFNNKQLEAPLPSTSLLTKTCSNFSSQPKSYKSPQNINTFSKTLSNSNIRSNGNMTPAKKPKFNFKATSFNKENKISNLNKEKRTFSASVTNSSQSCSQIAVKANNAEEKKITEDIFEGLDADSFFDDF
ncbi:uncharacterized protein LOC108744746 [Agrilus planipennis]|uniref:Uncharacterized protein LOC108744746 n=1 Tax=Agrilus planipennis TaxID=224129 RepID=A0A1W4XUK8_AGRPL|nr:uncharacterized protein LOC108744746 [Agrilus planipennis]